MTENELRKKIAEFKRIIKLAVISSRMAEAKQKYLSAIAEGLRKKENVLKDMLISELKKQRANDECSGCGKNDDENYHQQCSLCSRLTKKPSDDDKFTYGGSYGLSE